MSAWHMIPSAADVVMASRRVAITTGATGSKAAGTIAQMSRMTNPSLLNPRSSP